MLGDVPLGGVVVLDDISLTVKQKESRTVGWGMEAKAQCSMVLLYCPMHDCQKWVINTLITNLKASYDTLVGGRPGQDVRTVVLNVGRK